MVPHLRIEEAINHILGDTHCIVTAVPDEQKGEHLVVLYTHTQFTADVLWEQLHQMDLPKLWIPKREHFYTVETLPLLGTGKVDLYAARSTAMALIVTGEQ